MRGYKNCHAFGVTSISLNGSGDRIYIAEPDHTLWMNEPSSLELSVGLHQHKTDIFITPLLGGVYNICPIPWTGSENLYGSCVLDSSEPGLREYSFTSPLVGNPSIVSVDWRPPLIVRSQFIKEKIYMHGSVRHTLYVKKGEVAAWLVTEGNKYEEYSNTVITNADLTNFPFDKMYQPMTEDELFAKIREYKL